MGTPDFAARILEHILSSEAAKVLAVYTQPDRPCGRGQNCRPSPVKLCALSHDLPVSQPQNFKNSTDVAQLAALKPDLLLVAAYGLILPQAVLDIPRVMPVNVHASLLPKYRGAAPIQRAILHGDSQTGVSIMRMETKMDTGPVLLAQSLPIGPNETTGELHDCLAELGANALDQALARLVAGDLSVTTQDESQATYAPKIEKAEAQIDWNKPVTQVHNLIRAMSPKPGAYFHLPVPGQGVLRLTAQPGTPESMPGDFAPGRILGLISNCLAVACQDGRYLLPTLRPAGGKLMDARAFACGYLRDLDQELTCPPPQGT